MKTRVTKKFMANHNALVLKGNPEDKDWLASKAKELASQGLLIVNADMRYTENETQCLSFCYRPNEDNKNIIIIRFVRDFGLLKTLTVPENLLFANSGKFYSVPVPDKIKGVPQTLELLNNAQTLIRDLSRNGYLIYEVEYVVKPNDPVDFYHVVTVGVKFKAINTVTAEVNSFGDFVRFTEPFS